LVVSDRFAAVEFAHAKDELDSCLFDQSRRWRSPQSPRVSIDSSCDRDWPRSPSRGLFYEAVAPGQTYRKASRGIRILLLLACRSGPWRISPWRSRNPSLAWRGL